MPQPSRKEHDGNSSDGRMSARDLTLSAMQTVADLTGYTPESVTGFQWDGETWLVTVEVCELERIPNTTDVMGAADGDPGRACGLRDRRGHGRRGRGHTRRAPD